MKSKECCMNCEYYWANWDYGFCTIDNQDIPCELSHIVKCRAFNEWFGKVEFLSDLLTFLHQF